MMQLSSSFEATYISKANAQAAKSQSCGMGMTPVYGSGAVMGVAFVNLNATSNSWNAVILVASTDDLPSTRCQFTKECYGQGDFGVGNWSGDALIYIYNQNSLTETNKAETKIRNFTKVYNKYYYGNDTEKTNAEVYEILQQLYGNQYKSFIYYRTGGTSRGLFTAYGEKGALTSLYPQSDSPNAIGGGRTAFTGVSDVDEGWSMSYSIDNDPQYGIETDAEIIAACIFGDYDPNRLQFDVYVDGVKDPNVSVRWNSFVNEDFSLQLVTPVVWTLPDSQPSYPYINDGGILVPNEANPHMRKYANTWPGQYDAPYLSEFNACTYDMDSFTKTLTYGSTGIASRMRYLLRFQKQKNENNTGVMTWGNCYIVDVKREVNSLADIAVTMLTPSKKTPEFVDNVIVHLGPPPEDIPDDDDEYPDGTDATGTDPGVYDPDVPPHDFSTDESNGFNGKAILTKTYAMTSLVTQNVGSKIWSQSYFDVMKIQTNPIENIIAVKWFPFSVTGPAGSVKIGDVDLEINADVVDSLYSFTMGSVRYDADDKSNPSFLDMSPYTTLKLHLPYCGIVQLDATEMLNRKITVKYTVDLVSGDCMAFIYLDDNIPYMNVSGHCGVDIPLTSTNRIQAELRAASTTISAVTGAAAHVVSGDYAGAAAGAAQGALAIAGMDYTSQRTSSHSPACTSKANRACYLEIFKPAYKESPGFKSRHGYPCHLYKKLGRLSGFVKCDARTKIDFAMTKRENEMLEELLTSGVYV